VEIKTETDSTDITECSRNNKPITGCMLCLMHILYSLSTLCDIFTVCIFTSCYSLLSKMLSSKK